LDAARCQRLPRTLAVLPGSPRRSLLPRWFVRYDGRASDLLCRPCFESLPWTGSPRYERCGLPTAFDTPVCGACKHVDFEFSTARVSLCYEGMGKEIVHALKYRVYTAVVDRLAAPLLAEVAESPDAFDAVVPVPLHRARLRKRGFN
jgi:predicted amidophosphoribosyltransferase